MTCSAINGDMGDAPIRLRHRSKLMAAEGGVLLSLGKRRARLRQFGSREALFLHALSDGGRPSAICELLGKNFGPDGAAAAYRWILALSKAGFCERLDISHPCDERDVQRFDRLLHFFSEFETPECTRFDYLARLRSASVALVGVGGLGSWIAYNLLCCGVGHLVLIDGDKVEASNLNRSILFNEDSIGMPKAEAAALGVRRFAPRTGTKTVELSIQSPNDLTEHLEGVDLLIGTIDQPPWLVRLWVTESCAKKGVPNIQASGMRVGPFCIPGQTSCCGCDWTRLISERPERKEVVLAQPLLPRGTTGGLSPFGSIAAGVVSMDALRFLGGFAKPFTENATWEMDASFTTRILPMPQQAACAICAIVRSDYVNEKDR